MKIREWLKDPAHWCQGVYGITNDGTRLPTAIGISGAVKTCLIGAAFRCYPDNAQAVAERMELEVGGLLSFWNDTHTHAEVLALVERLDV